MAAKSRRWLEWLGVVVLLILLATAPLTYPRLVLMLSLKLGLGRTTSALDFTSASESTSRPDMLLAYASVASQAIAEGNYTEAKRLLEIAGKLPPNVEYNLKTYIALLYGLVQTLDSLKPKLDQLQESIADGAITQARGNATDIENRMAEASRQLNLLFSSLDQIQRVYQVDTGRQRRDLEALSRTLQSYRELLRGLEKQLDEMDSRTDTQLRLGVSPNPTQANETLQITGELQSGSIRLGGRVVELWINGIRIMNITLDGFGAFFWQYVVLNGSRTHELQICARYSPVGEDLSRFRPAKSVTITVPVEYESVVLTSVPSSKRVLVHENFTVEGELTDTHGTPLAGEIVDVLVDGQSVNSSATDSAGRYRIDMSFASGATEGEHQLCARFDPKHGLYAPAASENTTIQVYYLKPAFSQLALIALTFLGGEVIAISGQTVQLEGRLGIDSKPVRQGLVIASLGGRELARTSPQADGIFHMSVRVPLEVSDVNVITVVFVPVEPWVSAITTSISMRVMNSVVTSVAAGSATFAVLVFSGTPIDTLRGMRRRVITRRQSVTQAVAVPRPEIEGSRPRQAEFPLGYLKLGLGLELKFAEPRAFVKTAYWETRRVLAEALSLRAEPSQTPREYQVRVAGEVGAAAQSLLALTQLFELAEYSEHAVSRSAAEEGAMHVSKLLETVGEMTRL